MTAGGVSFVGGLIEIASMIENLRDILERRGAKRILIKGQQTPSPSDMCLILSNEEGLRLENPEWAIVANVIGGLDPGHGNSFCIMEIPRRGYVQVLRGFNGYHVEWREGRRGNPGNCQHWRGAFPGGSTKPFELKKHDHISAGEHRDLLPIEEVLECFSAFYRSAEKPDWLTWRTIVN